MTESHGFKRILGQERAVARIRAIAEAARTTQASAGHVLLVGPAGMGKRALARALAEECGAKLAEVHDPKRPDDLLGPMASLEPRDVLFIPQIERLQTPLIPLLISALRDFEVPFVIQEKRMPARTIRIPLKPYTCVATTANASKCRVELVDEFDAVIPLDRYSETERGQLVRQLSPERGLTIDDAVIGEITQVAGDTPHRIDTTLRRIAVLGHPQITETNVKSILSLAGFDVRGSGSPQDLTDLADLSGVGFEVLIGGLLQRMGFHAEQTRTTGDGGIDIVAMLDQPIHGGRFLVQCKRLAEDSLVGASTVRDFYGALAADSKALKGILITTSGFTPQARAFAENLRLELIDGDRLRALLTTDDGSRLDG